MEGELRPCEVGSSGNGEGLVQCPAENQRRELHLDLPIVVQIMQPLDFGMLKYLFSSPPLTTVLCIFKRLVVA